jgi:hypothetical protein
MRTDHLEEPGTGTGGAVKVYCSLFDRVLPDLTCMGVVNL